MGNYNSKKDRTRMTAILKQWYESNQEVAVITNNEYLSGVCKLSLADDGRSVTITNKLFSHHSLTIVGDGDIATVDGVRVGGRCPFFVINDDGLLPIDEVGSMVRSLQNVRYLIVPAPNNKFKNLDVYNKTPGDYRTNRMGINLCIESQDVDNWRKYILLHHNIGGNAIVVTRCPYLNGIYTVVSFIKTNMEYIALERQHENGFYWVLLSDGYKTRIGYELSFNRKYVNDIEANCSYEYNLLVASSFPNDIKNTSNAPIAIIIYDNLLL